MNKVQRQLRPKPYFPKFFKSLAQVILDMSLVLLVALDTGSILKVIHVHQVFEKMFEKWRELPPPSFFFFGNVDIPLCYLVQLSCDNMINLQIIFKIIKAFSREKNRLSQKPYRRGGAYAPMLSPVQHIIIT